jgi:hypothetical protein
LDGSFGRLSEQEHLSTIIGFVPAKSRLSSEDTL